MQVNGPEANAAAVDCDEEAINENQGENESLDITGEGTISEIDISCDCCCLTWLRLKCTSNVPSSIHACCLIRLC